MQVGKLKPILHSTAQSWFSAKLLKGAIYFNQTLTGFMVLVPVVQPGRLYCQDELPTSMKQLVPLISVSKSQSIMYRQICLFISQEKDRPTERIGEERKGKWLVSTTSLLKGC